MISEKRRERLVRNLLAWYKENGRVFPWRRTKEPYRILVAEIMLQKTGAQQAERVYQKFIDKYPSVRQLAKASVKELVNDIGSLGLAYRASRLKTISTLILKKYHGEIPRNAEGLRQLPGVGRYIANAVLCFAFGKDVPLVDANIVRVMTRLFSIKPIREEHKDERLWELVEDLIPTGLCKEFSWALLDLAALNCTPQKPVCPTCPLVDICDYGQTRSNPKGQDYPIE
jgi:A/G-specific adenine glycosylase